MKKSYENKKNNIVSFDWRDDNYINSTNETLKVFLSKNINKIYVGRTLLRQMPEWKNLSNNNITNKLIMESELIRVPYRELMTIVCDCINDPSDVVLNTLLSIHGLTDGNKNDYQLQTEQEITVQEVQMWIYQFELERLMNSVLNGSSNPSDLEQWNKCNRMIQHTLIKVTETLLTHYSPSNENQEMFYMLLHGFILQNQLHKENLFDSLSDIDYVDYTNKDEVDNRIREFIHDVITDTDNQDDPLLCLMIMTYHFKDVIEQRYNRVSEELSREVSSSTGFEEMIETIRSFGSDHSVTPSLTVNV